MIADETLHPFIIVRVFDLQDEECVGLESSIERLMTERVVALEKRDAQFASVHVEGGNYVFTGSAGSENGNGVCEDTAEKGLGDILNLDEETDLDVRVMVVFDDPKDLDYIDQASGGTSSDGTEGSSEEEEEAVETDSDYDEDEKRVIIDLTHLSEEERDVDTELEDEVIDLTIGSFCSQEL